ARELRKLLAHWGCVRSTLGRAWRAHILTAVGGDAMDARAVDDGLINLFDFEAAAAKCLPRMAWDYFASGAHDEVTLRENHAAYDRIPLRYPVLREIGERALSTTVLGTPISMPILIGPTAFHGLAHADAELASVRAAGAANTIMVQSTMSNV